MATGTTSIAVTYLCTLNVLLQRHMQWLSAQRGTGYPKSCAINVNESQHRFWLKHRFWLRRARGRPPDNPELPANARGAHEAPTGAFREKTQSNPPITWKAK